MNANLEQAKAIFLEAVERFAAEERDEYVQKACAGDEDLRQQVVILLQAHESGSLLDKGAIAAPPTVDEPITEKPGTQIGPYKLREQIGEGGFGVVYVAEQQQPVARKVALKIIKPGMDTRDVVARFEAERQALALMDHPNVAKVLDAGATESGRPYFVMELVRGLPITEFCDQQKLSNRERLRLFVDVCRAVQHAHQKGIIHRDLKPSNIMVTVHDDKFVPKVIDFGVSKALSRKLTDKSVYTGYGQMVGTPLYMSPEQAQLSGLDVDTRSDVYSLGVLLYELLTGTTPFDSETLKNADFDEMRRIIREDEPPRPSERVSTLDAKLLTTACDQRKVDRRTLKESLRGELDWIVMKALEKSRNRRYESASALAADVERHLNDESVHACPPSTWYRFRKFTRRNKVPVALAGMAIFALVPLAVSGFVLASSVESQAQRQREITEQRAVADARLEDALGNLKTAIDRTEAAGLSDDGAWFAAQQARQRTQVLAAVDTVNPALVRKVRALDDWFEQFERDRRLLERLYRIRLAQADTQILESRFARENALPEYARLFVDEGLDLSRISVQEAVRRLVQRRKEVRRPLLSAISDWPGLDASNEHPLTKHVKALIQALEKNQQIRVWAGPDDLQDLADQTQSPEFFDRQTPQSLEDLGRMLCKHPEYWENGIDLLRQAQLEYPTDFWINHELGFRLSTRPGHREEGVGYLQVAVALRPESAGPRLNLGNALMGLKRRREAVAVFRKALEIEPNYLRVHSQLGLALRELGELDQAIDEFRQAMELNPDDSEASSIYAHMGYTLKQQGKLDESIRFCRKSLELDPNNIFSLNALALAFLKQGKLEESSELLHKAIKVDAKDAASVDNLGTVLKQQGRLDEAITQHRAAIAIDPGDPEAHNNLGICLKEQGKLEEAIRCYRKAIELDPENSAAFNNLGGALLMQGKHEEAIACLRQATQLAPKDAEFQVNLGTALLKQGKLDEAVTCYRQAITIAPKYVKARGALGDALMRLDKPDEAIDSFREAIELSENEPVDPIDLAKIHTNFGLQLFRLGRVDEAVAHYRKAIDLDPDLAIVHFNLGKALAAQGKLDEAIACYRKSLELDPTLVQGHVDLGVAQVSRGESGKAIQCWREALKYAPDDLDALNNLIVVLTEGPDPEVHNPQEALKYARRAVQIDAAMPRNWSMLALAAFRAGEWDESLNAWTEKARRQPLGTDGRLLAAMTLWRLGNKAEARKLLEQAVVEIERMENPHEAIKRHQKEAQELIMSNPANSDVIPNSETLDR